MYSVISPEGCARRSSGATGEGGSRLLRPEVRTLSKTRARGDRCDRSGAGGRSDTNPTRPHDCRRGAPELSEDLSKVPGDKLRRQRRDRFRALGVYASSTLSTEFSTKKAPARK